MITKAINNNESIESLNNAIEKIKQNRSTAKKVARYGFVGAFLALALTASFNAYRGEKK